MIIPSVSVVFNWRKEPNTSGLYSVYLRISIERSSRYFKIPIPQKIRTDQWAGKENAWVKNSHPFAFEINNKITEKRLVVNELIKQSYNNNRNLDFSAVFAHLNRKGERNLFTDYMEEFIKKPPEKLELNTIKKYTTCLLHLKKFRTKVYFSDLDNFLLRDFNQYMQKELNLTGSTCKKYMESLKRVIRQARKENYLNQGQMEFMFDDIKIRMTKPKRTYLEPEEIKRWRKLRFTKEKEHLQRDRDLFLFQIYTGYYYKDLQIFNKTQLTKDPEYGYFIIGARDKNDNQTIIPLFKFPYAQQIIEKYAADKKQKTVFNSGVFIEEPVYNRNLKEIAKLAGIDKSVSNKVARHTNAQLWVRYGASRPVISKMLGHTKEETTKNYFDVNLPEIVEGTRIVDFSKIGI